MKKNLKRIKDIFVNDRYYLPSLISGISAGLAFPPINFYYLMPFAFVLLLLDFRKRTTLAEINRRMYVSAFAFTLITLYWVGSWSKQADTFLMISGAVLMFFNPCVFLIPSSLFYFSRKYLSEKSAYFLFPIFWIFFEYLYSVTDLRFPWLTLGNSQADNLIFIQMAELTGVYGISLILMFSNVLFALILIEKQYVFRRKIITLSAILLTLLVFPYIYGYFALENITPSKRFVKAGIVQPNLNPWDKWSGTGSNSVLENYLKASISLNNNGAEIIFWPETALPYYLLSGGYSYEEGKIRNFTDSSNVFLISGMPHAFIYGNRNKPVDAKPLGDKFYTSYNSVLLFSPGEFEVPFYGKIMLVPFGERVPFLESLPWLGEIIRWNVGISSWNVGKDTVIFNIPENNDTERPSFNIGSVICIESIYPEFVSAFVKKGANIIAVLTNDSWYGNSSGPYQHKAYSQLRAVENRRTIVRCANGGISCVIDKSGKTIIRTQMFTKDAFVSKCGLNDDITFYTANPLLLPGMSAFITLITIIMIIWKMLTLKIRRKNENS